MRPASVEGSRGVRGAYFPGYRGCCKEVGKLQETGVHRITEKGSSVVEEGRGVKEPGRISRLSGPSHDPCSDTKNGSAHHGPRAPSLPRHLLRQQQWLLLPVTMKLISCL